MSDTLQFVALMPPRHHQLLLFRGGLPPAILWAVPDHTSTLSAFLQPNSTAPASVNQTRPDSHRQLRRQRIEVRTRHFLFESPRLTCHDWRRASKSFVRSSHRFRASAATRQILRQDRGYSSGERASCFENHPPTRPCDPRCSARRPEQSFARRTSLNVRLHKT